MNPMTMCCNNCCCSHVGRRQRARQAGLTLVEVLLATAIMAMALAALSQLQAAGSRASILGELECEAIQLCQSHLDSIVAGASPAAATGDGSIEILPLAEAPGWSVRVQSQPAIVAGLQAVTVSIFHDRHVSLSPVEQPVASLTRWIRASSATRRLAAGGQP